MRSLNKTFKEKDISSTTQHSWENVRIAFEFIRWMMSLIVVIQDDRCCLKLFSHMLLMLLLILTCHIHIGGDFSVLLLSACGYFCSFHINHFRTLNRRCVITVDRLLAALKAANLKGNQSSSSYSNSNNNMKIHANHLRIHSHERMLRWI